MRADACTHRNASRAGTMAICMHCGQLFDPEGRRGIYFHNPESGLIEERPDEGEIGGPSDA